MKTLGRMTYALSLSTAVVCVLGLMVDAASPQFVIHPKSVVAACGTLCDDLVSLWNLDEVSGTRADAVGDNDLTDNNTVGVSLAGPSGTVANLDTSDNTYLSVSSPLSIDSDRTLSLWVRPTAIDAAGIASFGGSATDGTPGTLLNYDGSGNLRVYHVGYSGTSSPAPINYWYHVVITYKASTTTDAFWVNGAKVEEQTRSDTNEYTNLYIGSGYPNAMQGQIGPVGAWSAVLPDTEIVSLFNSGVGKKYADLTAAEKVGLVSYWDLDEASGNRADSHGSNTLTDNNTVGSVTNSGGAMHNAAASFVAGNTETLSRASAVLDTAADFTVTLWAKYNDFPSTYGTLVGSGPSYTTQPGVFVQDNGGGTNRVYHAGGAQASLEIANTQVNANDDRWFMLVYQHTASTQVARFKVIGVYYNSDTWCANTALDFPTQESFVIGNIVGASLPWNGLIDEVAVWRRKITDDEITELYASGSGIFYDGSVFADMFLQMPWRNASNDNWFLYRSKRPPIGLRALKKAS